MKKLFLLLLAGVLTSTTALGQTSTTELGQTSTTTLGQISDEQIQKVKQNIKKHAILKKKIEEEQYKPTLGDYLEPEEITYGLHYSYSKHFPLELAFNATFSYFLIEAETGFNFKKEIFQVSENKTCDPKYYLAIAPGFYTNYFSLSCGAGILCSDSTTESYEAGDGWSIHSTETGEAYHFMLRPNLKIFIPLDTEIGLSLSLNGGYDYTFKFKETNGWHFGIGIQCAID